MRDVSLKSEIKAQKIEIWLIKVLIVKLVKKLHVLKARGFDYLYLKKKYTIW